MCIQQVVSSGEHNQRRRSQAWSKAKGDKVKRFEESKEEIPEQETGERVGEFRDFKASLIDFCLERRFLPSKFSGEVYSLSINAREGHYEKGTQRIHTSGDRQFNLDRPIPIAVNPANYREANYIV